MDERWAWLSAVLAGRVFTHRLGADEVAHDMLAVSPDLDPITSLCEHDEYQRLVDGSAAQVVLAEFDDELLEERGIPVEAVDPGGALLLEPRTLTGLQVTEGDLVGLRLTEQGLTIERVTAPVPHAEVGARLAAVLDDDEPRLFDQVVWTACVEDPAAFTEPLAPLSEIADDCGLTRRGEWLAPAGFDFARWDFERGCARLVERHDIDPTTRSRYTRWCNCMSRYRWGSTPPNRASRTTRPRRDPPTTGSSNCWASSGRVGRPAAGSAAGGRDDRQRLRGRGRAGLVGRDAGAGGATSGASRVSLAARGGAGTARRHRRGRA
ncbi:hypothetical protein I552_6720 [Mycobacterium xenopi 3993]|nr:hypothetical protein I552_6720 [Mycobacterium xenopi 3993]